MARLSVAAGAGVGVATDAVLDAIGVESREAEFGPCVVLGEADRAPELLAWIERTSVEDAVRRPADHRPAVRAFLADVPAYNDAANPSSSWGGEPPQCFAAGGRIARRTKGVGRRE